MLSLNPTLPFKIRLEKAFTLAFGDKIAKAERKKGEAISEMKSQKINKSAGSPTKGGSDKADSKYSPDQIDIMKKWQVGKYKNKK